jgi:aspartyl-tRNA(Asn)/glutamyl-tRNA(Gln) amidotransferase subunit C
LPLSGVAAIGASRDATPHPAHEKTMSVDTNQVRHIAKLARIAMSDEAIEALVPELNQILGWVEQLAAVDTDGVEPLTAVIDFKQRLRDDVIDDGNIRDKVLANAPEAQHGFFAVPKVIE